RPEPAASPMTSIGLTLGAISTSSSMTVAAGSVISQNPAAGADVVVGSAVALVISSGLPHVAVPDVTNRPQATASSALTSIGLTVGAISTTSSMTVPAGSVISQNPAAAADVVVGSAVALVISSGLPHVAVPDVTNKPQATATSALTSIGLTVGALSTASSMTVPA